LLVNGSVEVQRSSTKVFHLSQILRLVISRWPAVRGMAYEDDDPFQRKDHLAALAGPIAEIVGGGALVCSTADYESRRLIEALKGYAENVYTGVA
ncbi:MAG: hypothetical protein AAFP86_13385, partial [Planctomycetota bacterium]